MSSNPASQTIGDRSYALIKAHVQMGIGKVKESKRLSALTSEHRKDLSDKVKKQKALFTNYDLPQTDRKASIEALDKELVDVKGTIKTISDPIKPTINALAKGMKVITAEKMPALVAEAENIKVEDIPALMEVPALYVKPLKEKKAKA